MPVYPPVWPIYSKLAVARGVTINVKLKCRLSAIFYGVNPPKIPATKIERSLWTCVRTVLFVASLRASVTSSREQIREGTCDCAICELAAAGDAGDATEHGTRYQAK